MVEVVTGVGKTQAATSVAMAVAKHNPDLVLNIGTAGTYRHNVGDILVARHFVDRNLWTIPIEGLVREIDLSNLSFGYGLHSLINHEESDHAIKINTGDNFVTEAGEDLGCDAVDMESFAMAWVCKQTGKPFLSVKYITDVLGQNSIAAWADKLACARRDLQAYFEANRHKIVAESQQSER